ncbi:MAG: hypothetical protein Q8K99_05945 [Actinomycetota bacterium]|nr:hypothetical protein [Actinomycetota bacterium]
MPDEIHLVPVWLAEPFVLLREFIQEALDLTLVTIGGIETMAVLPFLLDDAEASAGIAEDGFDRAYLSALSSVLPLAQRERDSDYRLTRGHAVITLWAALETWRDDLVVTWLLRVQPELLGEETDVEPDDLETAARVRLRNWNRELRANGVEVFEHIFAKVGLDGNVPDETAEALLEMRQIRHVYAHGGGRADATFLERCPCFEVAPGELVPVSDSQFTRYVRASRAYTDLVMCRAIASLGIQ